MGRIVEEPVIREVLQLGIRRQLDLPTAESRRYLRSASCMRGAITRANEGYRIGLGSGLRCSCSARARTGIGERLLSGRFSSVVVFTGIAAQEAFDCAIVWGAGLLS